MTTFLQALLDMGDELWDVLMYRKLWRENGSQWTYWSMVVSAVSLCVLIAYWGYVAWTRSSR